MAPRDDGAKKEKLGGTAYWPWSPRFWSGICAEGWYPFLKRNHFAVSPSRIPMALLVCLFSPCNSVLNGIQSLLYGRRLRQTPIQGDPIFIIGHWRSGTTLLHELLVLDERFSFPDTYSAFVPRHFLISGWWLKPLVWYLLPARRPMDNMLAGWNLPQEDEFALCNAGERSPYFTMGFPNRPPQDVEYLDLADVPREEVQHWQRSLLNFLKCLTLRNPKRMVLKSPPHTARIRVLLEMFPQAKFVHIVRDPYVLFPSTVNLWKRLFETQGLQRPTFAGLEDHVLETFNRLYAAFDRDRGLIPPQQYVEVRYEDLVAQPLDEMRKVYEQLALGGFERVLPQLETYFAGKADYKVNRYHLAPEAQQQVTTHWGWYAERYGYATAPSDEHASTVGSGR